MAEIEQQSDAQRIAAAVLNVAVDSAINRLTGKDERNAYRVFGWRDSWRLRPHKTSGVPVHTDVQPRIDVHSDAFKEWFAGSVMVNADGQPRSFWHGTFKDFDSFDDDSSTHPEFASGARGLYFTTERTYACRYGYNVLEVCLKVRRPYITSSRNEVTYLTSTDIARHRRSGYDAVAVTNRIALGSYLEICVFSPDQVRLIRREHIGGLEPREPGR